MKKLLFLAFVASFAASPTNAQSLNLIGLPGSGATIENGDLQDLTPFTSSNTTDFTPGPGANAPGGTFDDEDLEMLTPGSTPVQQVGTDIAEGSPFISIPGFTLTRTAGTQASGSGFFGFDNGAGVPIAADTPVADPPEGAPSDNIVALTNNGGVTLSSDAIDLPGTAGATTTFTLSFDIGVDGAAGDDSIFFNSSIVLGSETLLPETASFALVDDLVNGGTFAGDINDPVFDSVAGTIFFSGVDQQLRVTQTFSVAEDILVEELVLAIEILEDFTQPTGGVDRGVVDNIVLDSLFVEGPEIFFGDFDNNGVVDAADFPVFRDNAEQTDDALINNAGVNDGVIDALDFGVFVDNFGATASGVSEAGVVPEPASILMLLLGVAAGSAKRRRS